MQVTSNSQSESNGASSSAVLGTQDETAKWFWKMHYCKQHGLAPAQNEVWDYVEKKWQEAQQSTLPR